MKPERLLADAMLGNTDVQHPTIGVRGFIQE
jgi:hypothetical protein